MSETFGPRQCGACREPVIQAFTAAGRAVLLDYPTAGHGAIAARIDGESGVWKARYLQHGEETDPDVEVRFRQHTVTCSGQTTDSIPLILPPDITDTTLTGPPTTVLEPLPAEEPG